MKTTDVDVESVVADILIGAHAKLDALSERIRPTPPREMTAEEQWASLAELNRTFVNGLASAARRANLYLIAEVFGNDQQRALARRLFRENK